MTLSKTTVIPTANTKRLTFKGTGISKVAVVNDEVSVAAKPGFSGKTVVTITLMEDKEISGITADVIVIPLPAANVVVRQINEEKTRITWQRSPNAIGYEVIQNEEVLCTTKSTSCTLGRSISANPPVEIKSLGKDETENVIKEATYIAAPVRVIPEVKLVVNFDTNKFNLDTGDRILIQNFAMDVQIYGYKEVDISGHTDSRGGVDNNVLSSNRAKASRAYLLELIPTLKVTVNGYADVISVAPNSTAEGMAANRRAEFRVVK
jgi:outer membrane protein OmpA-like peptidoglycan-associated protein